MKTSYFTYFENNLLKRPPGSLVPWSYYRTVALIHKHKVIFNLYVNKYFFLIYMKI